MKTLMLSAVIGIASWYGHELDGRTMANGKPFNPHALTCASWDYPFGAKLRVSSGGQAVTVVVTDRGPHRRLGRKIDLSEAAFARLAPLERGLLTVKIERIK